MVEIDVILNTGDAKRLTLAPELVEAIETDDFDGLDVTIITMASGKEYRIADPPYLTLRQLLDSAGGAARVYPRLDHRMER